MATQNLLPTSDESSTGTIFYSSGSTSYNLLSNDDGDSNYIRFDGNGFVSMNFADMTTTGITINSVTMTYKPNDVGAHDTQQGRAFVKISGTKYYGGYQDLTVSGSYDTKTYTWTTNPSNGEPWTTISVNALIAGVEFSGYLANSTKFTYVILTIDYLTKPESMEITRHLASVDLWLKKRPESYASFTGNCDLLNVGIMQSVDMEHTAGPHATGVGWESDVWERRPFVVHGLSIDMNAYSVTLDMKDQRNLRLLVRDLAWSDKASGTIGDGIARFSTPGSTWTFTRAMEETFTNPVGESETAPVDVPGYADGGLQILAGASVTTYYVTNNTGERTWNAAQGSFQCEVKFLGALAQDRTIVYCYHDASNFAHVYYDNASGKIKFALRVAGTTTTITGTSIIASGSFYQVGVYWVGTNLENGQAAYTMVLYLNRSLEATGTATGVMTEAASSNLYFGNAAGATQLRGIIRKIHSYQDVLTPTEMARTI